MTKAKTKTKTKPTETPYPRSSRPRRGEGNPPPLPMVDSPERLEREIRKARRLEQREAEAAAREMDEEERQIQEAERRVEELARARADREAQAAGEDNTIPSAPPLPQYANPPPSYDALGQTVEEEGNQQPPTTQKPSEEENQVKPENITGDRVLDQSKEDQTTVVAAEGGEGSQKADLNKSRRVAEVKQRSEQLLGKMKNIGEIFTPNKKTATKVKDEETKGPPGPPPDFITSTPKAPAKEVTFAGVETRPERDSSSLGFHTVASGIGEEVTDDTSGDNEENAVSDTPSDPPRSRMATAGGGRGPDQSPPGARCRRCGGTPTVPPHQICQRCLEMQYQGEENRYKLCQTCNKQLAVRGRTRCPECIQSEVTALKRFQEAHNVQHMKSSPGQNKVADTIDESSQRVAAVSINQRAGEIGFMRDVHDIAEWSNVEERRTEYHESLNSLRETDAGAKAFISLGLEDLHDNIQRVKGNYNMERMAEIFQTENQFKIPLDGVRNFDDLYLYECLYETIIAMDELMRGEPMRKWVREERDTAFEDRNETMHRPKVARRHVNLRTKARILILFLHLMEYTPGVCGPDPRKGGEVKANKGAKFKARPIWHLQNWLYLLKLVQQTPYAGDPKDDARDIRKRIRNYVAVLKDLAKGIISFLRDFASESNADIRSKLQALARNKEDSCGESEFETWQGRCSWLLGREWREGLMTELASWETLLAEVITRSVKTPGILEMPPNFDWSPLEDYVVRTTDQRPKAKHVAEGLRNVTQEGLYVNRKRPKSESDSDAIAAAEQQRILKAAERRRANSDRTLTPRGREKVLENSRRADGGRRRRRGRSSSSEEDRGRRRDRPSGNGGRGPPDDDPSDDDDSDDDDDDSDEEDETTDLTSSEESTDEERRTGGREGRSTGGSRHVSFGQSDEPPCRKCGSERHATGSKSCPRNLDFCSYCNKISHSLKRCPRKNGQMCGRCNLPAHSDDEECPLKKAEAYNRNMSNMFRNVTKLSWPEYQARIQHGSDISGNIIQPELKLPPSQLANFQRRINDRSRQRAHKEHKLAQHIRDSTELEKTTLLMQSNEALEASVHRAMRLMKVRSKKAFKRKHPKMYENLVAKNTEYYSNKLTKTLAGEGVKNLDAIGLGMGPDVVFSGMPNDKYTLEEFFKRFELFKRSNGWGDNFAAEVLGTRLTGPAKVWYENLIEDEETSIKAKFYPNLKALIELKYEEELTVWGRTEMMQDLRWDAIKYKGKPSVFFEDVVNRSHKVFRGRPDHELVSWKKVREAEVVDKFLREVPTRLIEKMKDAEVDESVDGFRHFLERFEKVKKNSNPRGHRMGRNGHPYQVHAIGQADENDRTMGEGLMAYFHEEEDGDPTAEQALEVNAIRRPTNSHQPPGGREDRRCYECNEQGHIARDCPKRGQGDELMTQAVNRRRPTAPNPTTGARPKGFKRKSTIPITRAQGSTRKSHLQKGRQYYSTSTQRRYQVNAICAPDSAEDLSYIGQLEDLDDDDGQVAEEFEHRLRPLPEDDEGQDLEAAAMRGPGKQPRGVERLLDTKTSTERDRSEVAGISREVESSRGDDSGDPYGVDYGALAYESPM